MNKEENILYKRFIELANTCYYRSMPVFSDFLDLNEQTVFLNSTRELPPVKYVLDGGYSMAERKVVCFLPMEMKDYVLPVKAMKIEPANIKFAEKCTHRDFLGSIMNLGIDRCKIGDLIVNDGVCYVLCTEGIFDYISGQLVTVRHTKITCSEYDIGSIEGNINFEAVNGTVASVRLDSVLTVVFKESREHMKKYICSEKVFVNGKCIVRPDYFLQEGDIVSVRGIGKFRFDSVGNETRKGRVYIRANKYI